MLAEDMCGCVAVAVAVAVSRGLVVLVEEAASRGAVDVPEKQKHDAGHARAESLPFDSPVGYSSYRHGLRGTEEQQCRCCQDYVDFCSNVATTKVGYHRVLPSHYTSAIFFISSLSSAFSEPVLAASFHFSSAAYCSGSKPDFSCFKSFGANLPVA
jgi:hypothetical protein